MECCECAICGSDSGRGDRTQWIHEVHTTTHMDQKCFKIGSISFSLDCIFG